LGARQQTLAGDVARAWAVPCGRRGVVFVPGGGRVRLCGLRGGSMLWAEAGGSCGGAVW